MNLDKISLIFPIYKNAPYLEENIRKILEDDYPNNLKEIILTVDAPTEEFLNKLKEIKEKYKNNIKIILSRERRGKVSAINDAVKYSTGNILIFFDSDAIIDYINIKKAVEEINKYGTVEFYKEIIRKGWISKMMHIEYSLYFDVLSKILNREKFSFGLNGAAFGTKREIWEKVGGYTKVYVEDLDFALKVQEAGSKIYVSKSITIGIEPLKNLKSLIEQKKRWVFGVVETLLNHLEFLIRIFIEHPITSILIILLFWLPYIIWLYIYIFVPISFLYSYSIKLYETLTNNVSIIYLLILKPISVYNFLYSLYIVGIYILVTTLYVYIIITISKRKIYNPLYFFLFSIIYITLYEILLIYVLLYYVIFEKAPKMNWKV
jgi:cellulose synthase/poly-beta-1,6-N-acetylglucosamine synthase-like glycosyltransferase